LLLRSFNFSQAIINLFRLLLPTVGQALPMAVPIFILFIEQSLHISKQRNAAPGEVLLRRKKLF